MITTTTIERQEIVAAVRVCVRVGVVTKAEGKRAIATLRDENTTAVAK